MEGRVGGRLTTLQPAPNHTLPPPMHLPGLNSKSALVFSGPRCRVPAADVRCAATAYIAACSTSYSAQSAHHGVQRSRTAVITTARRGSSVPAMEAPPATVTANGATHVVMDGSKLLANGPGFSHGHVGGGGDDGGNGHGGGGGDSVNGSGGHGGGGVEERELHVEASESYLAYAMSVIVGRALPDVRDGLKPVHRRILYAMHNLGLAHNKPYKKCARVVGEVLGKYHPHGDTAVYDALVRLAQEFSMRHPLIAGHGNFGSLDDDPPAAMRYTECRLQGLAADMLLSDLEEGVVDWAPTFDASQDEPVVLPARVPHLLVNGSSGIAVGIATRIPPHNMREVVEGLAALIANPDITTEQLMAFIPGPDFPTGGVVAVGPALREAYSHGAGHVVLRAKVEVEGGEPAEHGPGSGAAGKRSGVRRKRGGARGGATLLVITEVPYQTSKAELVEKIAELVEAKVVEGVADVRDESDRDGVRVVVELKGSTDPDLVLAKLFKGSRLEVKCSCNMVALVEGTPRQMGIKDMLQHWLDFRCDVVTRRAQRQLERTEARQLIVQGLLVAMQRLDEVVKLIRAAPDTAAARTALTTRVKLLTVQADAVLALPLRRLTSLEQQELEGELRQIDITIGALTRLLGSRSEVLAEVLREAREVAAKHGTDRRTALISETEAGAAQSAIAAANAAAAAAAARKDVLVMWSGRGFVRRVDAAALGAQARGGKGRRMGLREGDALEEVVRSTEADILLALTSEGRGYSVPAGKVPPPNSQGYGTAIAQVLGTMANVPMVALVPLGLPPAAGIKAPRGLSVDADGEDGATAVLSGDSRCLLILTRAGGLKKTPLSPTFFRISTRGISMIKVAGEDAVGWAGVCTPGDCVLLASSGGQVLLIPIDIVRMSSRAAGTIRGIKLKPGQSVVGMALVPPVLTQSLEVESDRGEPSPSPEPDDWLGEENVDVDGGHNDAALVMPSWQEGVGPWVFLVTANGRGKRVPLSALTVSQRRYGKGKTCVRLARGDALTAVRLVNPDDDVVIGTVRGKVVRLTLRDIPVLGMGAAGVKLIDLASGDAVQAVAILPKRPREEDEEVEEMEGGEEDSLGEGEGEGAEAGYTDA